MAELRVLHKPKFELGQPELLAAEREYCKRRLSNFVRRAWHVVEPAQEYVHGWHLDAIGEHLEAVTDGQILRLAIAVPPGSMKSLISGVFWPMWEWGPRSLPSTRIIATSHSENLAIRDNLRAKRLVTSDWYQGLWGDTVEITVDQKSKTNFENTATGFRQSSPFTSLTGKRGDRVNIDDPLSVTDAASDQKRETVLEAFTEAVPTRMNNPKSSAIVMIMQRLHENDPIGYAMSRNLGYDYLMIPMEFEPNRRIYTSIGWTDPRTEEGQLMFPERFPREVVERDKEIMGPYASAGQMQQNPIPRKGGMFETERIRVIQHLPIGMKVTEVRAWDLAGTQGAGAYTVGARLAYVHETKRFVVVGMRREKLGGGGVRQMIRSTAAEDGEDTYIVIPQDPGQAGKVQSEDYVADLAGYRVKREPQSGSKETRAEPFSAQVEVGNVDIIEGPWNEAFLNEMRFFPRGAYKDQVDAVSSAFNFLSKKVRTNNGGDLRIAGDKQSNWASPIGAIWQE